MVDKVRATPSLDGDQGTIKAANATAITRLKIREKKKVEPMLAIRIKVIKINEKFSLFQRHLFEHVDPSMRSMSMFSRSLRMLTLFVGRCSCIFFLEIREME